MPWVGVAGAAKSQLQGPWLRIEAHESIQRSFPSSAEHAASAFSGAIPEFLQGLLQEEEEPEDDCIMILDD